MSSQGAFLGYRRLGIRMILGVLWATWLALVPLSMLRPSDPLGLTLLVGALVLAIPTWAALQGRTDHNVRMMLGVAVAVFPALVVRTGAGGAWQMDLHMSFFVGLTLLLPLCDWRPIVMAGGLIALHHLVLLHLLPAWVFSGAGSIGRVLLHAVLVGAQVGILVYATQRFRALVIGSETARREAEGARSDVQRTLEDLKAAQLLNQQRVAERDAAKAAYLAERTERRTAIAGDIQSRVGALATELLDAAASLSRHERALTGVSTRLAGEARALRQVSEKSLDNVRSVVVNAEELGEAANEAGDNAQRASELGHEAFCTVQGLEPRMAALREEIGAARSIVDLVSEIASHSNLLALNATIEAARSGEAGKGFGVVAHEMKAMADRTAAATIQINGKLRSIGDAAEDFAGTIDATMAHMHAVGASAVAVSAAVGQQRQAIGSIVQASERTQDDVAETDSRSQVIAQAASENEVIAARASDLAHLLNDRAQALGESMEGLLRDLRAA